MEVELGFFYLKRKNGERKHACVPLNVKQAAYSQRLQVTSAEIPSKRARKIIPAGSLGGRHETYTKLLLRYPQDQGLYLERRRREADT